MSEHAPAITAAILAGGFGTRLRSVLPDRQKIVAEVAGHPFVEYLLNQLRAAQISRAVLCTGHLASQVKEVLGENASGLRLEYSEEPEPLGTAGALRHAASLLSDGEVLVMNGDSFCDTDLSALIAWHRRGARRASMVLAEVEDTSRYGRVVTNDDMVTSFEEKGKSGPGRINAGIYLISGSLLRDIPEGVTCSLERDIFPKWVASGMLAGFPAQIRRFIDIGTPESLGEAQRMFDKK